MEIKSPCKKICKLNECKICVGCGRTLDEIINWTKYDKTVKDEIIRRSFGRITEKNNFCDE